MRAEAAAAAARRMGKIVSARSIAAASASTGC